MKPVSDPTILQQLNQQTPGLKPVTDSDLLNQLEGKPAESWTDNIRDPIAGALKIGPTALKGVADLARLITGDRVGVDTSEAMQRGMKAIDEVIGSERLLAQKANINQALQDKSVGITDLPGVVVRNPRAALDATVSTVGSMFLPAGVAAGAVKALPVAATAATQLANVVPAAAKILPTIAAATPGAVATGASVVTGAAQNAAETFADTAGQDMADRYKGAGISGAASLILGKLLGGGAEGVVARRLAGETGARGALAMGKSAVQTGGKEFLQETGEESSNYVGKQVAKDEAIDPNAMGKQGLYGGMIGFGMGGASDVATNVGNVGKGGIERQIADAIEQAAQEVADRPTPQTVQQTVARIFDRMPTRPEPEPAPQPAPGPLALGFDSAVRNPDPVMVADDQGNVRPMSPDEQFAQQELIKRMQDMGLTPDVQRAIQQRQQSPEPAAPSTPQDLIQRLMGTGWQPTAISSQGITPNPDSELVGALGQDFERLFQGDVKDEIRARLASQPKTETQPKPAPAQGPAVTDETADVSLTNEGKTPILQNRNRATQASISQMQSIAANPDYGRLGFSRDFANGAPVVAGGQIAPERLGMTDVAVASDGRRIPVQYAVVEAADVLTSNRADGTPNANYGNQDVQTIRAIAGNGRIAGLQAAYGQGTSQNYINELTADTLHGVNPAVIRGMRAPVLVRVMPQEAVTNDIGDVSNTTGNLNLSAVEQANNDAQRVNLEALQFGEDGGITAETVRQFVRAMPQAEQGGLLDTNGQPTKQAVDRINAAVFAKAYGNDQLVRLFAQAQDPEARLILSALAQLAPKMARLEGAGALDLRDIVTQAAEVAVNARRNGVNLQRAAQQIDMTTDPLVGVVLDLFARNPRSNKAVVESLGNMADLAYTEATKPAEDMFGSVPRASRADVVNQLRPQDEQASQENLEQPAGREPVQVDAGRTEAQPAAAADPEPAQASGTAEADDGILTGYTPQEIEQRLAKLEQAEKERQQQDREAEQRAEADAQRDDFTLTGSNRDADVAAARGQQDIFSAPAEDTQEDAQEDAPQPTGKIEDLGEKIGGARKDTATSTGRNAKPKTNDERPAWARRFQVSQIAAGDSEGRWVMRDTRSKDWMGQPKQVGGSRNTYATEQEAVDAVPLAAVSMKHRAVPTGTKDENGEYTYEIWRDINDRKRVKVVDQTFPSRVAALEYMAKNAQAILETNTTFGEADLPRPDNTDRTGAARRTEDVDGKDFMETFGFRGVEFGNWNNQAERQEVMNAAYDGLMDLAEVMQIPAKAIGLNGDLALAFGARGQGLSSAVAHYERTRAVINLTKMNGAGALAHEWLHAMDHYFGRQDGKASSEWRVGADGTKTLDIKGAENDMASGGFKRVNSGVRQELRDAYKNVMETMFNKAEKYVEDTAKADQFVAKSREDVARRLDALRKDLSEQKDVRYYKRNNKPASAEQLAEFDTVTKQIINGESLEIGMFKVEGSRSATGSRWSTEALEKLSAIYKSVRGRSGFGSGDQTGVMDSLRGDMTRYSQRLKMLAEAQAGDEKTKRVPTEFAMSAKELDQGRGEDYWTTPHEMAARAFQGYVEDKIAAQGARSPFLNYAPENAGILTPWGAKRPYPYGKERKAINEAFDAFVKTLQTKATDKGVAIYSQSGRSVGLPLSLRASELTIEDELEKRLEGLAHRPDVRVLDSAVGTLPGASDEDGISGANWDGRIYLFRDQLSNRMDVQHTLFHELLHYGLRRFLTKNQFIAQMKKLYDRDTYIKQEADDWVKTKKGQQTLAESGLEYAKARGVDEALATLAEPNQGKYLKTDLLSRAQVTVTRWLAQLAEALGFKQYAAKIRSYKNEEARQLIQEIFTKLRKDAAPARNAWTDAADPAFATNGIQSATNTWTVPEPGTMDNAIRAIQNNKIDMKRVRDSIAERFGKVNEDADAYLNEELYHGKVAARVEAIYKDRVEPILAKIAVAGKNAGVTMDDVNQYLHARHAPERNAAMKAINPDMQNNEALSGMSNQEAAKVMADFTAAGKDKALALIARDVDQLLSDTRTDLVADGLEDAGVIAAWEAAYKHYVPLQRDIGSSGTPKGMGFSVRGPESKRAVGSNKEVVNILANIVAQAETAAIRAEKAAVGRSLLAMARQYPNPDFWTVDKAPTKPRINKDTGLVERNAVDPMFQTADNVIMVKDYGQEHFIVFNKKNERAMATAKAMKHLDIAPMNKIFEVANKGTRFLASLLTQRNPLFWLTNFARDVQGAMINLEGTEAEGLQRQVMANLPKAFKGMHSIVRGQGTGQWARYAKEMQEAGGTTGYMQAFENSDARMKDLKTEVERMQQGKADPRRLARVALEFVDDYNDIIENAVRLSVFQAAREGGASTAKAASIAKNITVNFNRKGNLTPPINALYMFFNASVQGTARLLQATATSKTAQAAVGGIAVMGFMLDMLNRMAAGEDDETKRNRYDLIPEFEKSRNWIFMNPMRPGEYVKVPLPLGPHVFHNAGRLMSDAINRKDARNASEYGWSMAGIFVDAFSPLGATPSGWQLMAPSVADPIAQVMENKSFTGAPVYKSADRFGKIDPKPAYTRYFDSTPDVWKGASRMLNDMSGGDKVKPGMINVEPDILKHVFYTLTGGPGRTLDQAIDSTQAGARGKELTVNRVPLVSRFYGANDDQQRERAYYDDNKRAGDAKTQHDYYVKQGRMELAKEVLKELGDGDEAKGRKKMLEFSRADKSVRKINGEIRRQMERDDDGEAKAEQLKALRQRRVRVMSDALDGEE
ncbi:LPD38 domain-containing protein [Limnohabitans sp.]|uniref:LPD38 domain-containing protein n=1 Tax=Limnohabitans sp. TaxID=1907725 RepID=UPI0025BEC048|nr:LPD38 domain-containing protein [Limnohabitans sp.]